MSLPSALVHTAYKKSVALLRHNLTPHGLRAASPSRQAQQRNYLCVFARDTAICALGMLQTGDAQLIQGARQGLCTLARYQADNGQIPNYVDGEYGAADFWYVGRIDATLWWLIAVDYVVKRGPDPALLSELRVAIDKALRWLQCQEHPQTYLLQQNEASDWADIMPRSGFVLYSNALWYRVKQDYGLARADLTRQHFNQLFYPFDGAASAVKRLRFLADCARAKARDTGLYLSFVNFSFWGEDGDVFGNLLAVLFGLADAAAAQRIIRALQDAKIAARYPVASVLQVIGATDPLWRPYMGRHDQNFVQQYHNGGIWPFLGGFWVLALAQLGMHKQASDALQQLAVVNGLCDWRFSEWLHGASGEAQGMAGQSWNAAMFVLACKADRF